MLKHILAATPAGGPPPAPEDNPPKPSNQPPKDETTPNNNSSRHHHYHAYQPQPRYQNARSLRHHQPLNVSTLDSSKHSLSSGASPAPPVGQKEILRAPPLVPANVTRFMHRSKEVGIKEMLTSLGLLCLVSLLLALLSLIFLLKISPVTSTDVRSLLRAEQLSVISAEEYVVVYEVTLALCALTLSLNLCCLLVCAIQFLFAVKLVNSPNEEGGRTNKYLQKSAVTRVCAVGGFFISIPVFLTGIILYTFIQFHSTPAIVTSAFIGLGIIFCGCAMVHNVFVWQKEKTNAVKALQMSAQEAPPLLSLPQNMSNGYLPNGHGPNGHIPNGHASHGNSFMNSTAYSSHHHPINILMNQTPYMIRPPTSTPPTPGGDLVGLGSGRPPRPPRPPAPASASPPGVPSATLDLSHHTAEPHELSTLV